MKVVIIGASGQDGLILREIFAYKADLLCISRDSMFDASGQVSHSFGFSPSHLLNCLPEIREFGPDLVFYLPAVHGPSTKHINSSTEFSKARDFLDNRGLVALLNSLDALKEPPKFFYAASSKVYGSYCGAVDESTPFNPACDHGVSKALAVKILESHPLTQRGNIVIGILFHHHSRHRKGDFALSKLTENFASGRRGRDRYIKNWSAAEDFSDAYQIMNAAAFLMEGDSSGRFVLGAGRPRTLDEIRLALIGNDVTETHTESPIALNTCWASSIRVFSREPLVQDTIIERLRADINFLRENSLSNGKREY